MNAGRAKRLERRRSSSAITCPSPGAMMARRCQAEERYYDFMLSARALPSRRGG